MSLELTLNDDERLHAEARGAHVHLGAVTGDHPGVLHPAQPGGHRAPGDAGDAGQLQVAGARALAQGCEQADVQIVEVHAVQSAQQVAVRTSRMAAG